MAPSTPPPPIRPELAAFTITSAAESVVMSPRCSVMGATCANLTGQVVIYERPGAEDTSPAVALYPDDLWSSGLIVGSYGDCLESGYGRRRGGGSSSCVARHLASAHTAVGSCGVAFYGLATGFWLLSVPLRRSPRP